MSLIRNLNQVFTKQTEKQINPKHLKKIHNERQFAQMKYLVKNSSFCLLQFLFW